MEELLTIDQVADRLKVTRRTVQALVRCGKLGCVQVTPKQRRFTEGQVREFIESRILIKPKFIDRSAATRVTFAPKPPQEKGGNGQSGFTARAQLRKEMRQWR